SSSTTRRPTVCTTSTRRRPSCSPCATVRTIARTSPASSAPRSRSTNRPWTTSTSAWPPSSGKASCSSRRHVPAAAVRDPGHGRRRGTRAHDRVPREPRDAGRGGATKRRVPRRRQRALRAAPGRRSDGPRPHGGRRPLPALPALLWAPARPHDARRMGSAARRARARGRRTADHGRREGRGEDDAGAAPAPRRLPGRGRRDRFLRDGIAVALPRPFHLKPGTARLVPELAPSLDALPSTSTSDGMRIVAFDPALAGFDWHLRVGPVDGVVVLRRNHDGEAHLDELTALDAVRFLVDHAFPATESRPQLLRAAASVAGHVTAHQLEVGPVEDSARALREIG